MTFRSLQSPQDPFVGREEILEFLNQHTAASRNRPPQIIRLWGQGGIGKSAILGHFCRSCPPRHVVCAYVECVAKNTPADILSLLSRQLKHRGLHTAQFSEAHGQFRTIQAKRGQQYVSNRAERQSSIAEIVGGASGLAAEATNLPADRIGNLVEQLTKIFLASRTVFDFDLEQRPYQVLSERFLSDIGANAHGSFLARRALALLGFPQQQRRIVLIIDNHDVVSGHREWLRDFALNCPGHVSVIISGRTRFFDIAVTSANEAFAARVVDREVSPMSDQEMGDLVRRLVTVRHNRCIPDQSVDDIVRTSSGIPFNAVFKVAEMVRRPSSQEGHPPVALEQFASTLDSDLYGNLLRASILRGFNQRMMKELWPEIYSDDAYRALTCMPVVTQGADGYAVLDAFREFLIKRHREADPIAHSSLEQQAHTYFLSQIDHLRSSQSYPVETIHRLEVECLYHACEWSEEKGSEYFRKSFDKHFHLTHQINLCQALVNEARQFRNAPAIHAQAEYYSELLRRDQPSANDFPGVRSRLEELMSSDSLNPELELNLCEFLGTLYWYYDPVPGGQERAEALYHRALQLANKASNSKERKARVNLFLSKLHQRTHGGGGDLTATVQDDIESLPAGDNKQILQADFDRHQGDACRLRGHFKQAERHLLDAYNAFESKSRLFDQGHVLRELAMVHTSTGNFNKASQELDEAERFFKKAGYFRELERAWLAIARGDIEVETHQYGSALCSYGDAARQRPGDDFIRSVVLGQRARLLCRRGRWGPAIRLASTSLEIRRHTKDSYGIGLCQLVIGWSQLGQAMAHCDLPATLGDLAPTDHHHLSMGDSLSVAARTFSEAESTFRVIGAANGELQARYGCACVAYVLQKEEQARELVHALCADAVSEPYNDLLAKGLLLRAFIVLKFGVPKTALPGAGGRTDCAVECFCESLDHALDHNVLLARSIALKVSAFLDANNVHHASKSLESARKQLIESWRASERWELEQVRAQEHAATSSGSVGDSVMEILAR